MSGAASASGRSENRGQLKHSKLQAQEQFENAYQKPNRANEAQLDQLYFRSGNVQ